MEKQKTGADYKIELRDLTQSYLKTIKTMREEIFDIIKNDDTNDNIFYKITLSDIDDILSLFSAGTERRKKENCIENNLKLTQREREIVYAIANGLTPKDIQDKLAITKGTLDTHFKNILYKIETENKLVDILENTIGKNEDIYELKNPYKTIKFIVDCIAPTYRN